MTCSTEEKFQTSSCVSYAHCKVLPEARKLTAGGWSTRPGQCGFPAAIPGSFIHCAHPLSPVQTLWGPGTWRPGGHMHLCCLGAMGTRPTHTPSLTPVTHAPGGGHPEWSAMTHTGREAPALVSGMGRGPQRKWQVWQRHWWMLTQAEP